MLVRILLIIVVATAVTAFSVTGCKKSPDTRQEQVKTLADYQDEAKEQITEENMAEELENIEQAVEREISQEQ